MMRRLVVCGMLVGLLAACGNKVSSHSTLTCYSDSSSMQTKTSYTILAQDSPGYMSCP